jgi:hypothetical protein
MVTTVLSMTNNEIFQAFLAAPRGQPIFLDLMELMMTHTTITDGLVHTKDFCKYLRTRAGSKFGSNVPLALDGSTTVPVYMLQESKADCAAENLEPDRYGLCVFCTNSTGARVIQSRYPDYPWADPAK